jgi:hypothetical protein
MSLTMYAYKLVEKIVTHRDRHLPHNEVHSKQEKNGSISPSCIL